jgi:hypothetical protein
MSKSKKPAWVAGFACVTALAGFSVSTVAAQTPSAGPVAQHQHEAAPTSPASAMTEDQGSTAMGQHMMAMRQKMMADQKAAIDRLQPLLETMNAAKGEARVDAMAAVLTELVHQRSEQMPNMMGAMMQSMSDDMRKLAAECPMMKGAGDTPQKR